MTQPNQNRLEAVARALSEAGGACNWEHALECARAALAADATATGDVVAKHDIEALLADKARLDYLDRCNASLNAQYGSTYGWTLIQNHNVNRLMLDHLSVDLNDMAAQGLPSCRDAIDQKMRQALTAYHTTMKGEAA